MQRNIRKLTLGVLLILTLIATGYVYLNDTKDSSSPESLADMTILEPDNFRGTKLVASRTQFHTRFLQDTTQDIFQPRVQVTESPKENTPSLPPPPIVITAPVLPPPQPTVPPMPFTYIGKYMEDGELVVFLGYRGKNLIVRTGDIIQQIYKIEKILPPVLAVTYIPMNVTQNIQIGELK